MQNYTINGKNYAALIQAVPAETHGKNALILLIPLTCNLQSKSCYLLKMVSGKSLEACYLPVLTKDASLLLQ